MAQLPFQEKSDRVSVDERIRSILLPLTAAEREALTRKIREVGPYQPAIVMAVDGKLVVVDGHERLEVCKELGITCPIAELDPGDIEGAIVMAASLNFSRVRKEALDMYPAAKKTTQQIVEKLGHKIAKYHVDITELLGHTRKSDHWSTE